MHKPSFVGIGVQKCASTWIHRILEDHPEVAVSSPKEVDFFSYHYHFGFAWYENHFGSGLMTGENSPSYFCDARVPQRLLKYNPDIKIIVCLRDPIERIVSHHAHEVRLGHVSADMTFGQAIENNPMYVEQSLYAKYLKLWFDIFPKEQILILLQEEIRKEPEKVARNLYDFLGVDVKFKSSFLARKANVSQTPKSKALEGSLKKAAKFLRSLGLDAWIKYIKQSAWVRALRQKNMREIKNILPIMSEQDIHHLDSMLKTDLEDLKQLTTQDLNMWPTWQRCAKASPEGL